MEVWIGESDTKNITDISFGRGLLIFHSAEGATVKQLCMRTNILCYRMLCPRDTSYFCRM